ncbi:MAG: AMP-binding acetyl-CoA synthetase [Deltaproteobacteria bacterium]|nr:MAG: AMP-binding acetyl-CoA synthetase [Deltaproteobacteria bacterium]
MTVDRNYLPLERLYRHESERPDSVWLTQPLGGGRVKDTTWKEAVDQARRMAAHLKSYGFEPGSTISIISKNCDEFILAEFAIWMAGYTASPIYPTLDKDTIAYILEHSESKLVFLGKLDALDNITPALPEGIEKLAFTLSPEELDCPRWPDIVRETEPIEGRPVREPDEVSIIFYTSGSTGRPKGVENTFANMAVASKGVLQVFQFGPDDRYLSYLPLAHSFESLVGLTLMMVAGARVFFAESLQTFVQDIQRAHPTLFISVPRLWLKFQLGVFEKMPKEKLDKLLRIPILGRIVRKKVLKGLGLDAVRIAISGSAPIPPELIEWYRKLGLELLEGYGMTENFSYSHCSRPGRTRVGYVGETFPGVECKIDENGEILVRSGATMKGYHKMPEETAKVITEDGFLRTGDMGSIDEQGRLKITGRVKELFKTSKGKYVHPVPIENMLNASPFVELALVAGLGREQPAAIVQLAEEYRKKLGDPDIRSRMEDVLSKLRDQVNAKLVDFERLKFIAVASSEWTVDDGLLTPTMKIRRAQLEQRYGGRYDEWYSAGKPVVWE